MATSLKEYVDNILWERRQRPPSITWWNSLGEYKQTRLIEHYYPELVELDTDQDTQFRQRCNWHSMVYNMYIKSHQ